MLENQISNKIADDTKMLENQISNKISDNTTILHDQISASEGRLQKHVNIFQEETNAKFNDFNKNVYYTKTNIKTLDTDICQVDSKHTFFQQEVNAKFENFDSKLIDLDDKIVVVDKKLDTVNNRLDLLERKIDHIDNRVDNIDSSINSINDKLNNFIIQQTKFNDDTDKNILDISKYIQEYSQKIITMEKTVDINAEQIQGCLKLVDVRKSEIGLKFTKSLTELSEQLGQNWQKIAGLKLSHEQLDQMIADLSQSTDNFGPIPVVSSVNQLVTPIVGPLSTGMERMPTGTPVVTNSATVSTTNVVSCDDLQACYVSNSIINPVNTPSPIGQSTNHKSFAGLIQNESNPNSNIACSPSVPHSNFNDTSCQNIVSNNNEPQRTIHIFYGTVNWIMDLENRCHSYNSDKHHLNLGSMNVRDSYDRVPERPSRGPRDNDRDLPANYGQKSDYMSPERDRDERTFSPSSLVNRRRNSRSHYYSRDHNPANDFSRN